MAEVKTMRDAFITKIYERMADDEKLFFVSADFGAPSLDQLREDYGERFINVGIAEQNLINVATGLALEGFTTYAYAIATFISMRAYEQIRNNLSLLPQLRELNVNMVGVGAGLSYDVSGPSHHCLEDLSVIRTLPNIELYSPSDWVVCEKMAKLSMGRKGPKYFRLDGKPHRNIYEPGDEIDLEKGFHVLNEGEGLCLVTTGYMTHTALKALDGLSKAGINAGLIDVFSLRPFSETKLLCELNKYGHVVTVEEGFIHKGGLDGMVASVLQEGGSGTRLKALGFADRHVYTMGERAYLHAELGLDAEGIATAAAKFLK